VPEFGSVDEAFSGVLCILAAAVVLLLAIPLLVFGIELMIIGLVATGRHLCSRVARTPVCGPGALL